MKTNRFRLIFIIFSTFFVWNCQKQTIDYEKIAIEITKEAKSNLQEKLMKAMKEGGTEAAIPFCQENAMAFTKRLGIAKSVTLKRITDRPRNQMNLFSTEEAKIFSEIQKKKSNDGVFPNRVVSSDESVTVYVPIVVMGQCVQCHGKPENITKETKTTLQRFYPNDQAIGYEVGDLRGLFSVRFPK
ncbi:Hypothetical protein LBF_1431 [Leptospira biflexa serovar Patoc strain 'Patoc 1 (Ames)']|uniref:Tll0287-like domain-containing protein n=1 Tax=Leptospira biflexa serovar Patoc (strain Patoc 1 / ATCC 23582 / Paris) TaxID=456481 RepID=B0SQD4_LEPBP|nr:DUF3365 domain-containing protein [Leptospira biflexa]ABZ93946.1 Hypothetical protein LBF_1431 [Leptospira biflexa serovar Patoc strain 'Patoc 1 (Ames)']ABZ97592.1 Hypothetical protein; putative signal peptide [Leptospira biflexa serovar Patoc strain 'Patoc 1 (Paris)']